MGLERSQLPLQHAIKPPNHAYCSKSTYSRLQRWVQHWATPATRAPDIILQLLPWCSARQVTHHVDILVWKTHHSPVGLSCDFNTQSQWLTSQWMQVIHFTWKTPKYLVVEIKCFWPWPYTFLRRELVAGPYLEVSCNVLCESYQTWNDISVLI